MAQIDLATSGDRAVLRLLRRHPRVSEVQESECAGVQFHVGSWRREVTVGDLNCELFGLVEMMDNNPLVCADRVSIPSAHATLALIALGPLAAAGLIIEAPVVITGEPEADEEDLSRSLRSAGWQGGVSLHRSDSPFKGHPIIMTTLCKIRAARGLEDIDSLYEERFDGSFFVRRAGDEPVDAGIEGAFAEYGYRFSEGVPDSLVTTYVRAYRDGKCGASQIVHCMNVMCGLEESLGIPS